VRILRALERAMIEQYQHLQPTSSLLPGPFSWPMKCYDINDN
jgi:hypothetical protein